MNLRTANDEGGLSKFMNSGNLTLHFDVRYSHILNTQNFIAFNSLTST
jgi:hypothetical protein